MAVEGCWLLLFFAYKVKCQNLLSVIWHTYILSTTRKDALLTLRTISLSFLINKNEQQRQARFNHLQTPSQVITFIIRCNSPDFSIIYDDGKGRVKKAAKVGCHCLVCGRCFKYLFPANPMYRGANFGDMMK
jgi:hypothetical protein